MLGELPIQSKELTASNIESYCRCYFNYCGKNYKILILTILYTKERFRVKKKTEKYLHLFTYPEYVKNVGIVNIGCLAEICIIYVNAEIKGALSALQ